MAIKKKKSGSKTKQRAKIVTPIGRLSYPYLVEPDTGRENSDDKYKTDLLIPKADWKEQGKELRQAVLTAGREFFQDVTLQLKDFKNPFKDTDELDKYSDNKDVKGCVLLRAKSEFRPVVIDTSKEDMDEQQVRQIKGGDYARLVVVVYPYKQQGGGITLGLNLVQYVKPGESLGGGKAELLKQLDDIEVDPDEIDDEDMEDEEDEKPAAKKKSKKAEPEEDEEEEDDSTFEDSDDSEESEEESEEEESEEDDEEEEDEEEDEKPAKKTTAKKGAAKKPAEKTKKGKKGGFDFDDD